MFIEYCDGGALDSIIVDLSKGLTERQIAYVCRQMCQVSYPLSSLVNLMEDGFCDNERFFYRNDLNVLGFGLPAPKLRHPSWPQGRQRSAHLRWGRQIGGFWSQCQKQRRKPEAGNFHRNPILDGTRGMLDIAEANNYNWLLNVGLMISPY